MAKHETETNREPVLPTVPSNIPAQADYVIIGNSAAGISAAEAIRAHDGAGSICMLSREPYVAYGKPLISYLIEGKTEAEHMAFRDAGFYERLHIACGFGPAFEVRALDAEKHELSLADGTRIVYGTCLLACGSTPFVPAEIGGWQNRDNIHSFECLDDALALREDALKASAKAHARGKTSRALVVGGGLTGLKAAEALTALVDDVIVLTHGSRIMSKILDDVASELLIGLLEKHAIHVVKHVSVRAFEGTQPICSQATLTDGTQASFDVAVTAVGVRPACGLAQDAGAAVERGIVVDERLQTTLPDVYAAGDVVQATNAFDKAKRPIALWTNAVRQGKIAGTQMTGAQDACPYGPDYAENIVDFFDIPVMTCGIVNPDPAEDYQESVIAHGDAYAKFVTRNGLLAGYVLVNLPDACGIYNALIGQAIPLDRVCGNLLLRAPRNLDFSEETRWERLHEGYPHTLDRQGFEIDSSLGRA